MFGDPESVIKNAINTVADVADVQVGLVIKPTRFYSADGTGTPAFRSLNIGEMYIRDSEWVYFTDKGMVENQRTIAHTGDVLVVRSGYPGTSCVVTPEYDGRNVVDLIIAHPNVSKILPEFLCAFTNYPHGKIQIENSQRGVAQKHFNVSLYNKMKIVVPPMELQKQFVQLLHQSDKSKFSCLKSQFIEMFGDPDENPMNWPVKKLSDVAKVDGTMTKEYEKYADLPHIGIDSIEKNTGILSGYRTVKEDNVISPKYHFGPQHILYSKIRPALNKVAVPEFEGLCSADCYPLLPIDGFCERKFLAHVLRSDYFLRYVLSFSVRSQMPKVNRKQLEGFAFPCPSVELQKKFIVLVDQSDKSK